MSIDFKSIHFLTSAARIEQAPADFGSEVAFAGRSNVGKSSALNTLTNKKQLARTSKTPGRTQLINFFELVPDKRLVDLPGYGYAKVSKAIKKRWQEHLEVYLATRQSLKGIVLLVDARHPPKEFDEMMVGWSIDADIPLHILLTKTDKLSRNQAQKSLLEKQRIFNHSTVSLQLFSSVDKTGLASLEDKLTQWLNSSDE